MSGGHYNKIIGNDVFDVATHLKTGGNSGDGLNNFVPTNNAVSNNHFTQVPIS